MRLNCEKPNLLQQRLNQMYLKALYTSDCEGEKVAAVMQQMAKGGGFERDASYGTPDIGGAEMHAWNAGGEDDTETVMKMAQGMGSR